MRLATVKTGSGESSSAVFISGQWHRLGGSDLSATLPESAAIRALVGTQALPDAVPVLPLPRPSKVVCCGLNYADHIAETGRETPEHPTLFAKFADTLIGPGDDIVLPDGLLVDWEAELAVVVGSTIRRVDREAASKAIAGYTVANDISIRDWQRRTLQWFQGKAWDRTTPLGPVLVTPDEIEPRDGLDVVCRVNGVEVQRGNTRNLVFDSADLLAYISTFTELRPGDLVLTGTPGGVGMSMSPPTYLADGDVVETEISGIGTLVNSVRLSY